jgi:superfamily II DNA/RNA helicase
MLTIDEADQMIRGNLCTQTQGFVSKYLKKARVLLVCSASLRDDVKTKEEWTALPADHRQILAFIGHANGAQPYHDSCRKTVVKPRPSRSE